MPPDGHRARLRRPLKRAISEGHPWIWRDALAGLTAAPGEEVTVFDDRRRFVGRGLVDEGPIGVRVWTTRDEPIGTPILRRRIHAAAALRAQTIGADTTAYRLLHGEGDRLPGIVCDVYGTHAVLRFDGSSLARIRSELVDALTPVLEKLGVETLLQRSGRRGKPTVEALLGEAPEGTVDVLEHGMSLRANLLEGQKTGLFLDHRESRRRVRELSASLSVLNLYGYTGGFSVAAGLGGAKHVTTVDIARPAIMLADETWAINGLAPASHCGQTADAPAFLAQATQRADTYDLIVSDPPSFAPRESSVEAALSSYRKLHAAALGLLAPGGYYLAASCSSHVRLQSFAKTVREGARRAKRVVQVLDTWGAPPDHPRLLAFPEGDYLKVLLCRISD